MSVNYWIEAARLRTLPLAISTMVMGHSLAASDGFFNWNIAILSILTAVLLQVFSNLSNDYGDSIHGADGVLRKGPKRAVQSGKITQGSMKKAIIILGLAAFSTGILLIFISFQDWVHRGVFIGIGLVALWAAYNYTAGPKPYGYSGKGDIFVFVFFGLVTVLGSYYLQAQILRWEILLPAITCGTLSVGVLNVNNIRDIDSDLQAGKKSVAGKLGRKSAVRYHALLLCSAIFSLVVFTYLENHTSWISWTFLIATPLFIINYRAVSRIKEAMKLDPYLKQLALSTTLLITLFCIGVIFG